MQALAAQCYPSSSSCVLTLVKLFGNDATKDVLGYVREARELGLQKWQAACIAFIAQNAAAVAKADPTDITSAVLAGAIAGRYQKLTPDSLRSVVDEVKQEAGNFRRPCCCNCLELLVEHLDDYVGW